MGLLQGAVHEGLLVLSFGKIRASWGKSGQKFQEAYLAHGLMEESNSFLGQPGLQPSAMANSHLTWEKSDQYDLGLDLDLFNYRFKVKGRLLLQALL